MKKPKPFTQQDANDWRDELKRLKVDFSILDTPAEKFAAACERVWKKGKVATGPVVADEAGIRKGSINRIAQAATKAGLVTFVKKNSSNGFYVPIHKGDKHGK